MDDNKNERLRFQEHPVSMEETIILKKPFGVRIQKTTWKIVYVDPHGAAVDLAFVGDIILSVDNAKIHDSTALIATMRNPTTKAFVKLRRNAYSHCRYMQSTVETLVMKCETKLLRAVNVYRVCIHAKDLILPDESDLLGLLVSYDAREQLQVASTKNIAAIHLRPGDTIKEVNRQPVGSKSMLRYWMLASMEKNGFVELLIHSNVDQISIYDYELEMPEDVLKIATRQVEMLRTFSSEQFEQTKTILRKNLLQPKQKNSVFICDKIIEFPIASDYNPEKLGWVQRLNRKTSSS